MKGKQQQTLRYVIISVGSIACLCLLVLQSQLVYQLLVRTGHDDGIGQGASLADRSVVVSDGKEGRGPPELIPGHAATSTINTSLVTLRDFRRGAKTGNPLIDYYGHNDPRIGGEMGRGIALTDEQNEEVSEIVDKFKVNNLVSDAVPLNRIVPDSRLPGCSNITYNLTSLGRVSVIIPFFDEWPSLILRTVYSVINRTPTSLLQEIILVDDCSTIDEVKGPLGSYIHDHFPRGLVKVIRMPQRKGLASARMAGVGEAQGDVLVFFDSHMEVNIDWLPPLLTEISKDRQVVAMSHLDYIKWDTFEYHFDRYWMVKYGWDWSLKFFETYFRPDEVGTKLTDPRPGTSMVGAAFAVDRTYFLELGGYDTGMSVWGGENLEMTWRVTLCGGKLVHLPCSKIGHVARPQPYSFPGGRVYHELYNLKRAVVVWMGNYSRFVYEQNSDMKDVNVGDLSERLALRDILKCKDFGWYLENIWPELHVYDEDVVHWGQVANEASERCLDNNRYIFQARELLYLKPCHDGQLQTQGFSLTKSGRLRTTLQCVVTTGMVPASKVVLEDCLIGPPDTWLYDGFHLVHAQSSLCMEVTTKIPIIRPCEENKNTQKWTFVPFSLP